MMYYPFVHPPRPVLWQALLYWDELTSIAPVQGYDIGSDLEELQHWGVYTPTYADDLPRPAYRALVDDLRHVVEELPGKDLVPVPGPLEANNRLYWGKLPSEVQDDLLSVDAAIPQDDMLLVSPVLLSRLMVVLAKHLAAATTGMVPFTESSSAYNVAFAPLAQPSAPSWLCWQLQIGQYLPVPADDTPLEKVLAFRDYYSSEREELAGAVGKLLLLPSLTDLASEADLAQTQESIDKTVQQIKKAAQQLEKAGHSRKIVWVKRSLLVLGGLGAAGSAVFVPPLFAALLTAASALGIGLAPAVTRTGVANEFSYLQQLQSRFPGTAWPSPAPAT